MIAYLRGTVLLKQAGQIIIETGGVGYEVSVPLAVLERVHEGQEAALFVHHAVRDDGHYPATARLVSRNDPRQRRRSENRPAHSLRL